MVEWVHCRACKAFDRIAVATDDERIAAEVKRFGGNVVMTSPTHLNGTGRCVEALCLLQQLYGEQAEVVVNIQGDEPFVDPALLLRLAACFENPDTQIATVVRVFDEPDDLFNPNCVKVVISLSGRAIYFSRSAIPYIRGHAQNEWLNKQNFYQHIGLYAYRADVLPQLTRLTPSPLEMAESLEQNRWLENDFRIRVVQTEQAGIAIDTPEDLEKANKWLAQHSLDFDSL
jgi:3-deoxy-manno-octulosonate cytidylyltransferase (CMP-KDO synthetase)